MIARSIAPGVYEIPLGIVNAFLIQDEGLTLIDTGLPGSAGAILEAVRELGGQPGDIRRILVTHCHVDHSGSLAALKQASGAPAYMHRVDAALVRAGKAPPPLRRAPGIPAALMVPMFRLMLGSYPATVEPAEIEHEALDGRVLPQTGGIRAIHVPGHCAGQLAFLWPKHGGVLFAADAAQNLMGLGPMPVCDDPWELLWSFSKLADLEFEVAGFGHGRAITHRAAARFRQKSRAAQTGPRPT